MIIIGEINLVIYKWYQIVVIDIVVAGLIVCVFVFFHHVSKIIVNSIYEKNTAIEQADTIPSITNVPAYLQADTSTSTDEEPDDGMDTKKSEWQIKFSDHFSDCIIETDNSYVSPNISINIEKCEFNEGSTQVSYQFADIYIGRIECFQTYLAPGVYRETAKEKILPMMKSTNAILAINGDYFTGETNPFIYRNGVLESDGYIFGTCLAMYYNGEMEYIYPDNDSKENLKNSDIYQIWWFGPPLIDENGCAYSPPLASGYLAELHPRTAIGYYEPGHYCFVTVDGRHDTQGCGLVDLASIMEAHGCTLAYNLDGGGSSVMAFNGKYVNTPSSRDSNGDPRAIPDIILIKEP